MCNVASKASSTKKMFTLASMQMQKRDETSKRISTNLLYTLVKYLKLRMLRSQSVNT